MVATNINLFQWAIKTHSLDVQVTLALYWPLCLTCIIFSFWLLPFPQLPHIPLSTLFQNTLTAIDCHRLAYGGPNEVHNRLQDCTGRSVHCTVACENVPWGHATRVVTTVSHKPYKTRYLPDRTLRNLSLCRYCVFLFRYFVKEKQEIVGKTPRSTHFSKCRRLYSLC